MDARVEDIIWSINEYDRDGDECDRGIFLHFGTARVKVANSFWDFTRFVEHITNMKDELREAWQQEFTIPAEH